MLDNSFIEEQVNNMMLEKGYDKRAKALLIAFYTCLSDTYNLTESQFLENIEKYKQKVENIAFYNVGASNYVYTRDGDLIFDKETSENLDSSNVERFLQASIKGNASVLFELKSNTCIELTEMSSLVNMYDYPQDIYLNINGMLAGGFDIDSNQVVSLYEDIFKGMEKSQDENNRDEYEYYNTARILIQTINDRILDIKNGDEQDIKESFEAIYALSLLNISGKIDSGLVTDTTVLNYAKLCDSFKSYMSNLDIKTSELSDVLVDRKSNWRVDVTKIISKLDEKFKDIEVPKEHPVDKFVSKVDRQKMIETQKEEVTNIDLKSKVLDIDGKVNKLIEEKNYPE